jgi:hypothetical protein
MSRAKAPSSSSATMAMEPSAIAAFLRSLAGRVEADPALAGQVAAALCESGLLPAGEAAPAPPSSAGDLNRHGSGVRTPKGNARGVLSDPFAILRTEGEDALRRALDELPLSELRHVVRAHRLDPARISARWASRERVVQLIVGQVRARLDHGKAFSHV